MASQFVIAARGVIPTEGDIPADAVAPRNPSFPRKRESRDLCDRKAGIGRAALDSWSPIGVGDELRGNDGGAVDSRFRGMTGGRECR